MLLSEDTIMFDYTFGLYLLEFCHSGIRDLRLYGHPQILEF